MAGWRYLRQKLRIEHASPVHRRVVIELALQNLTDRDEDNVPLQLDKYRPGLSVVDGRGSTLSYLPRSEVAQRVDPDGDAPMSIRAGPILWVVLAQKVPPLGIVVLTLSFADVEVEEEDLDILPRWRADWIVREPVYRIRDFKLARGTETAIVEITGPPDSRIEAVWGRLQRATTERVGESPVGGWFSRAHFHFARIPAGGEDDQGEYVVMNLRSEKAMILLAWHLLFWIPLAITVLALALPGWASTIGPYRIGTPVPEFGRAIGLVGASATMAILGFIRPVWVHRVAFLWPLGANLLLVLASRENV